MRKRYSFIKILLLYLFTLTAVWHASGQTRPVSGTVTGADNNQPLAGVAVAVINAKTGTTTDEKGRFTLQAPPDASLVFSHTGYLSRTVPVPASGAIQLVLEVDTKALDEVVVIGYGQAKKKDLTGAIAQIRPEKIADQNPNTVQDLLRGTPGLMIGFDPSAKGGGSVQIRGQRSVYTDGGHNDPLIILDGMIFYGEFSELNPDDIEQIDVLKDASAAAVYGAKSANGVIIVSTKKGKKGKPQINFTSNLGIVTMGANRKVFGPQGYLQYRQDWYTATSYGVNAATGNYEAYQAGTGNGKPGYYERPAAGKLQQYGVSADQWRAYTVNTAGASDDEIWARRLLMQDVTLTNFLSGKTFDWYDHSFRTGINQDYNISISGAADRMNYYMSLGYLSNQGVAVGNDYKTIRSNIKVNGKATDWLEIGANINFQQRTDGDLAVDWNNQVQTNSPFANYADSAGNPVIHPMGDLTINKGYNYDFDRKYRALDRGYTVLNTILSAKVKLPFHINYSFNVSPRYQWYYNRYFESSEHPDWSPLTHGVTREYSKRLDWSLNNTINWEQTFGRKHRVNVTLVQEVENRQYWYDIVTALNIQPTDALGYHETGNGDVNRSSFNSDDTKETADGMLARVFYSYDDRYMITTSVRRDGYSAFGTSNPRASFFSAAFAWTFTNEKFFQWKPLTSGKLRLSWGQNGNRSLANPYIALADLAAGTGATQGYLDANGNYIQYRYLSVNRLANTNLKWEKTASLNAGLDFNLWNNRLTGSLDYFVMPTTNMIMNQSLPGFSGVSNITTNLGEVQNRGFEISLSSQNVITKNFSWSTTFGFSKYKNTIKHLYNVYQNTVDASGNITGTKEVDDVANGWFIGHPIGAIWDYKVTGIWQASQAAEAATYGQRPGDPKVANAYTADDTKNANGTVTPVYNNSDKQFMGQTAPPIMWSLRNDFTLFKNFSFSFNMYSYWGHKSLSATYLNQDNSTSQVTNNANSYAKRYWTLNNATDVYARLDAKGPAGVTAPQRLFDRSFIRLDNLTLGYSLPSAISRKWLLEKVKFFGSIRNLALWKKDRNWEYWDVETGGLAPRIYNIGLNITF